MAPSRLSRRVAPLALSRRVASALGPEPLDDARHLLAPIVVPASADPVPAGPRPGTEFLVDAAGTDAVGAETLRRVFQPAGLGVPRFWVRMSNVWKPLDGLAPDTRVPAVTIAWELSSLLAEGDAAVDELSAYVATFGKALAPLGWSAVARETPARAAERSAGLVALRLRFARSVEMRLMPTGRRFAAREVWRAAYALGVTWGDMNLFHWHNPGGVPPRALFTLSAVGQLSAFLPERVEEGETVAGLVLSFELPGNPAPLATFDRMAVALGYLGQKLGGRPMSSDGSELDHERLYEERDALEDAVAAMRAAGIPPGSPDSAAFF